jgi:hypothetical protein
MSLPPNIDLGEGLYFVHVSLILPVFRTAVNKYSLRHARNGHLDQYRQKDIMLRWLACTIQRLLHENDRNTVAIIVKDQENWYNRKNDVPDTVSGSRHFAAASENY